MVLLECGVGVEEEGGCWWSGERGRERGGGEAFYS